MQLAIHPETGSPEQFRGEERLEPSLGVLEKENQDWSSEMEVVGEERNIPTAEEGEKRHKLFRPDDAKEVESFEKTSKKESFLIGEGEWLNYQTVKKDNKSRKAAGTVYVTKMGKLEIWKDNKLLHKETIDKELKYTKEDITMAKKNGEEKMKIIKWKHKEATLNCGIFFRKEVERDELFRIIEMVKEQEGPEEDMGFGLFD